MVPQSEVVIRQEAFLDGRVLFVNAPTDDLLSNLASNINASVWTWNFNDFQYFQARQATVHFGVELPQGAFDQAIVFVPKSKELLNYILHNLASRLSLGASIFLVGEKKGGVERASKQLLPYGKTLKLDSARHCQMWQTVLEKNTTAKALEDWAQRYTVPTPQGDLNICALPGVFSQNRLDVGTAVFLPYLSKVSSGKIADFGCGAGVISAYLAKLNPKNRIFAMDVDAFALASTKMTFEENSLVPEQLEIKAVSGIEDAPLFLHAIVSNPPFHQGIQTDYNASENLCKTARRHLKSDGELWIVANRFLNYPVLIEQSFGQCITKADQQGFKVLFASTQKKS
ncbi:methyltransferase domain-containing protein [Acinetobacter cumulans]|uniref:Ribosomal RNA small subunit methyltransferase C n=1 Tax=Acinetobacter cumulans TaxID=2136182 RepID=A0A498D7C1_9GAMM|nr:MULTISPECIES: methyltransferase [Acinetobacter]NWK74331.1 methyltransferase [Acinetobacter sp. SwsAc6]QCO20135.1 methyltransferase [Acinetobacter cumulans]RKG42558.1 methyltransferase domain-containing protein [Acinetobacter cumulans]RKG48725.1 methyltransferase domain-containing protein [Acinetobacter cumulans]RLL34788.1 methyltransferase domain-containing protein [Acinetobacter cumulans]